MVVAFSRSLFLKQFLPIDGLQILCGISVAIFLPILTSNNADAEDILVGLDTFDQFNALAEVVDGKPISRILWDS
jgi:hypothetical protein